MRRAAISFLAWAGFALADPLRQPSAVSACLLMIVRDEEHNLRQNLPLWAPHISCYVIGIDSRTADGSEAAVHAALDGAVPPDRRFIFPFDFDGLGASRTFVLREAWRRYPDATHVIMADPDWRLHEGTIDLTELDFDHSVFALKIWDRNGSTNRWIDWIFLHIPDLTMRYHWHEALVLPDGVPYTPKLLHWEVSEVETNTSWHVKQHGSSFSYNRYVMEIGLLEKDEAECADDPRVLYYLGIDHLIAAQHAGTLASDPKNDENGRCAASNAAAAADADGLPDDTCESTAARFSRLREEHLRAGFRYLERRAEAGLKLTPTMPATPAAMAALLPLTTQRTFAIPEMTWAALFWLGYARHHLAGSKSGRAGLEANEADLSAEDAYEMCAAFDPGRADCHAYLSLLHLERGRPLEAWVSASNAASLPMPERSFMNSQEVYSCFVPQQAARAAAAAAVAAAASGGAEAAVAAEQLAARGRIFLEEARQGCAGTPFAAPANLFESIERQLLPASFGQRLTEGNVGSSSNYGRKESSASATPGGENDGNVGGMLSFSTRTNNGVPSGVGSGVSSQDSQSFGLGGAAILSSTDSENSTDGGNSAWSLASEPDGFIGLSTGLRSVGGVVTLGSGGGSTGGSSVGAGGGVSGAARDAKRQTWPPPLAQQQHQQQQQQQQQQRPSAQGGALSSAASAKAASNTQQQHQPRHSVERPTTTSPATTRTQTRQRQPPKYDSFRPGHESSAFSATVPADSGHSRQFAARSGAAEAAEAAARSMPVDALSRPPQQLTICGGVQTSTVAGYVAAAVALLDLTEGKASAPAGACLRRAFEAGGGSLSFADLANVSPHVAKDSLHLHVLALEEAVTTSRRAVERLATS